MEQELKNELIRDIFKYEAVKFGSFTLKSGVVSPIYMDIRVCVSHPEFLTDIANAVEQKMTSEGIFSDHLCGVPYTALPIATCISTKTLKPMVMRRKEAKAYGTKQIIEGKYSPGDKVLVIEDIVTTGSSILETVKVLEDVGLQVTDAIVFIDREQGGAEFLKKKGILLHPVLKLSDIIHVLENHDLIDSKMAQDSRNFILSVKPTIASIVHKPPTLSFNERLLSNSIHPVAKKLLNIITAKETNLCVAVDVSSVEKLLDITEQIGPYVCAVKTHIDAIDDFAYDRVIPQLQDLAKKHNFLLFEDRKFGDIGETVRHQYGGGVFRIAEWADMVTIHGVPGEGVIQGLKGVTLKNRACLMVAEMSSRGALTNDEYKKACVAIVDQHKDFAIGFVSQSRLSDNPDQIQMTPGVRIEASGDGLGQQYVTPQIAVMERGADVVIVGRGVAGAKDPVAAAREYSQLAWMAYKQRMENVVM